MKYVNQLRITGNKENGQIFVECKDEGLTDAWVEKISQLNVDDTTIRKCHSYTGQDVLVRFSCIHSNVDYLTNKHCIYLYVYGQIKYPYI